MKNLFKINKCKYFKETTCVSFFNNSIVHLFNYMPKACMQLERWTFELSVKKTILSTKFHISETFMQHVKETQSRYRDHYIEVWT